MALLEVPQEEDSPEESTTNDIAVMGEVALVDWNRPEEDEAWEYLQHDHT